MKKFFSSIFGGSEGKYQPEKGVPECAGKTTPIVHRGNVSWELADFRNHLEADTKSSYPSISSGKLCLPTEKRLTVGFTVFPKGISAQTWQYLGLRFTVHSVPNESAQISYKILMLNGKNMILATSGECLLICSGLHFNIFGTLSEGTKEFKAKDFVELDKLILLASLDAANQDNKKGQPLLPGKEPKVTFVCEVIPKLNYI